MILTPTSKLPEDLQDSELDEVEEAAAATELPVIELVLDAQACGERLDKILAKMVPQYSRSRLQQWIEAGQVTVDGQAAKPKMTMLGDERIVIQPQLAPQDHAYQAEAMELAIVYEDEALIVIDKPAGLVVHPAAGNWSATLLNGLLHHCPALENVPRAGIVHRLDKDTTGLMVVAKTLEAQTDLVRQLQARDVSRQYLALVWGSPHLSGTVEAAMARHPRDRIKMAVSESMYAKPAVTHYQRLAAGKIDRHPVSLLRCRLETGRTHQIRVHMQSLGFPLVGDPLYGKQHLAAVFPRQALHACRLGLNHPVSGEYIEWSADLPADMQQLLAKAGIDLAEVEL